MITGTACTFINLNLTRFSTSHLIKYKDNVHGLLFIIAVLIKTGSWKNNHVAM